MVRRTSARCDHGCRKPVSQPFICDSHDRSIQDLDRLPGTGHVGMTAMFTLLLLIGALLVVMVVMSVVGLGVNATVDAAGKGLGRALSRPQADGLSLIHISEPTRPY